MNRKLIVRQAAVIAAVVANAALSEVAAGVRPAGGYTDVVSTVRAGSVATLFLAGFLFVVALWCGRPTMITELPPFTMQSIWAHVYGLGLIVFVTVYCMLGVSSCCFAAYIVALSGVSIDDIMVRHWETLSKHTAVFLSTLFSAAAVVVAALGSPDLEFFIKQADKGNWLVIACGTVLPALSPFIYTLVRGPRNYTPGMVVEFIYFAAPFAVILSVVVLCTLSVLPPAAPPTVEMEPLFVSQAEANWSHAYSANRSMETKVVERLILVTAADVAMPLLPLTMFPVLFLTVKSVFLHSTVDMLTAASFVAAFKHLCHSHGGGAGLKGPAWPLVLAAAAFAWRLYAIYLCGTQESAAREGYRGEPVGCGEQEKLACATVRDDIDVADV